MKVVLAATHPIQYQVPWFRALDREAPWESSVAYAWLPDSAGQGVGFGVPFQWDLPLLDGYRWEELERTPASPALGGFFGLRLSDAGRWLRRVGPNALIVTGWHSYTLVQLAFAAWRQGIPIVARGDSLDSPNRPWWRRVALRSLLRMCAAFLVVGERNRKFYRDLGIGGDRLFDCPHFVDNERFAAAVDAVRPERATVRERFGLATDAACALFAGKLIPEKNLGELIVAASAARSREPRFHLLLVGDGSERPALERTSRALGAPVTFAGFLNQSEISAAYAAADFLVLPSRSETWGLVVNEAMASGLPVIVSDRVGCAPDLVENEVTGFTYECGDSEALASRMVRLASDLELTAGLGRSARQRVAQRNSVARAVAGTVAAIAFVTGRRA